MQKIDLTNKNNMRCKYCQNFQCSINTKTKISDPIGYCNLHDSQPNSSERCEHFIYADKYIIPEPKYSEDGRCLCHRCNRTLTDESSVAKGFGKHCYDLYLREIKKLSKRLF